MKWRRFLRRLALALPISALFNGAIYAQVPFYQGKTITMIVSSDAGGTSDVRNDLAVDVAADSVRFLVNNRQVHAAQRSAIPTDGQVGLRINHALNLHVSRLEITPR